LRAGTGTRIARLRSRRGAWTPNNPCCLR
jgi:hypothetical protein